MSYLHGAYGEIGESVVTVAESVETVTVYVGAAPVNLIRRYKEREIINKPIRIDNASGKNKIGYSKNWDMFNLSEVIDAHFNNNKGNIGPVYVINVLDPDTHRKSENTTVELQFSNGKAEIESDTIILDTLALEELTEGTDYEVSYSFATGKAVITSIGEYITGVVTATYKEVVKVSKEDVIGNKTDTGIYTGISVIERLYPMYGVVPTLVGAPGWSEEPEVYKALVEAVKKLNGHWYGYVVADIPIKDTDTISKAIQWKAANGYESMFSKVCWPMVEYAGNKYHLSTLAIVEFMRNDAENDGVPMGTCSNKTISCSAQYFGESTNQGFDIEMANTLNAKGITTVAAWNGTYQIWGPHTAAFEAGEDGKAKAGVDILAIFDSNIRTQEYILNSFQSEWGIEVDEPMTIGLRDTILEREQEKLDGLVAQGALIGNPTIEFLETENSDEDLLNGDFMWHYNTTPTPLGKSFTAKVVCTNEGYNALISTGEEE